MPERNAIRGNGPRDKDELTQIPTVKPARDEVLGRRQTERKSSGGGGGGFLIFVIAALVLLALSACYYLFEQNRLMESALEQASTRIESLESQLANTGDEMSQSDAAVRIQLKQLDAEVRKLWDNVWKKSKDTLALHDTSIKKLTSAQSKVQTQQKKSAQQMGSISANVTQLSASVDEISQLTEMLEKDRAKMSLAQKQVNSTTAKLAAIEAKVDSQEEWLKAIDAFRKQVNQRLNVNSQTSNQQPQLE